MDVAKIFWSGRSQAVRLPKGYRFQESEVSIRRRGATVVLEPIAADWNWLDNVVGTIDDDFARMATDDAAPQERPSLDFFR
jgi:antitoxin VapB